MKNSYGFLRLTPSEREDALEKIHGALARRPDVSFAYVHGSFLSNGPFRDIDVAIHLSEIPPSSLQTELDVEMELNQALGENLPVEVRLLHTAPLSFCYSVIKNGLPVFTRDEKARTRFVEVTLFRYLDFAPFHQRYLRETLGIGVRQGSGEEDHL